MIRPFIPMSMLYAILLTSCALLTQQPVESATTDVEQAAQGVPVTNNALDVGSATTPTPTLTTTQTLTQTQTQTQVQASAQSAASGAASKAASGAASGDDSMDRVERRKIKQQRYAAGIDSLVQSHNFRFLPNSMQELPGGFTQLIYNELYFVGVFKDHVEVHMPTVRGSVVQYIEILNFDTFEVKNYQVSRTQFGWSVSFNMVSGGDTNFAVSLMVYNQTGETVLNLLTMSNTVRYVGYIQPLTKN